jgi:hypothetical protein
MSGYVNDSRTITCSGAVGHRIQGHLHLLVTFVLLVEVLPWLTDRWIFDMPKTCLYIFQVYYVNIQLIFNSSGVTTTNFNDLQDYSRNLLILVFNYRKQKTLFSYFGLSKTF